MIEYFSQMWELALDGNKQGVVFFIAAYALLMLLYSWFFQLCIRRWPVVRGRLLSSSVEKFGETDRIVSEQDYTASAVYQYEVDGLSYQGKKVSPWIMTASHNARFILQKQLSGIQRNEDGTVNVFYNPRKPKKSYLIKPGFVGLSITFVLAFTPAIIYWFAFA